MSTGKTILKSMEEVLKETYENHRNVVNPDENWAEWEVCLKDGTAALVYEAMSKWANQCTIGLSERLDYQINQGWRQHEEIEALKKEVERIKHLMGKLHMDAFNAGAGGDQNPYEHFQKFKQTNNL